MTMKKVNHRNRPGNDKSDEMKRQGPSRSQYKYVPFIQGGRGKHEHEQEMETFQKTQIEVVDINI